MEKILLKKLKLLVNRLMSRTEGFFGSQAWNLLLGLGRSLQPAEHLGWSLENKSGLILSGLFPAGQHLVIFFSGQSASETITRTLLPPKKVKWLSSTRQEIGSRKFTWFPWTKWWVPSSQLLLPFNLNKPEEEYLSGVCWESASLVSSANFICLKMFLVWSNRRWFWETSFGSHL